MFDTTPWFDVSRISRIIRFGDQAYEANDMLKTYRALDGMAAKSISKRGFNTKYARQTVEDFLRQTNTVTINLEARQKIVNESLGRQLQGPKISLDSFKPEGFRMPAIIKKVRRK